MGNLVLLLLTFLFFLDLVTAQNPAMDPSLPTGSGEPFYPDPDNLLSSICDLCGISFQLCLHRYAPFLANPPMNRFIDASDLLSHPDWPRDLEHSEPQQLYPQHCDHDRRQRLQRAQVQRLEDGPATIQPSVLQVWTEGSYNPGDRTAASPQRRNAPKKAGFPCLHPGCKKAYNRHCDLKRHTKVHLDKSERPYKCSDCPEAFHYPKDHKRHQRTHRSMQKTPCPVKGCTNTDGFSREDNYQRHMRNQHPNVALVAPITIS